jgi:hypothetical protein
VKDGRDEHGIVPVRHGYHAQYVDGKVHEETKAEPGTGRSVNASWVQPSARDRSHCQVTQASVWRADEGIETELPDHRKEELWARKQSALGARNQKHGVLTIAATSAA